MRLVKQLFYGFFIAVVSATGAAAESMAPDLPSSDQIRKHYQESAGSWSTIPRIALLAFVAAEDRRFFESLPQNSTITRQIGSTYLQPSLSRLQRVALSSAIGEELSHDELLNWYLNEIFLGQDCFGLPSAAVAYFGKTVDNLNLEEAAYLAALGKAPLRFHPVSSYEGAIEQRNFVLLEMLKAGFISEGDAERATQAALIVSEPLARCEPTD